MLDKICAIDPDVIVIGLENASRDTLEQMFQVSRSVRRPIAMFVDTSDTATIQAAAACASRMAFSRRGSSAVLPTLPSATAAAMPT